MKHINFILALTAVFCFGAFSLAFSQGANLSVMTENGEYFNLKLDGRVMNSEPHQSMLFEGLAPGFYRLQTAVVTPEQEIVQLKKSVNMEPGQHYKFNIKTNRNGEYVMRIFAIQPIMNQPGQNMPPPPSAGQHSQMSPGFDPGQHPGNQPNTQWDDMGSATINGATVRMSFMDFAGTGMSVQAGPGGASMSVSDGQGGHVSMGGSVSHTHVETHTHVHTQGGGAPHPGTPPPPAQSYVPGYNGPIGCPGPIMAPGQFQQALGTIKNRSFADEQKTVAKQVLRNNCITVNQLKQLLQVFSFEDDKLEMAKFAYDSTHDIGNYYMVNDVFTFSSSTEELEQFLNGR